MWRSSDQWTFSSSLSLSGPVGPLTHSVVISPIPELILEQTYSATSRIPMLVPWPAEWEFFVAKWNPLELPQPRKIASQKQYHILGRLQGSVPESRTWKMQERWVPPRVHSTRLFNPFRRQTNLGEWQWIVTSLTRCRLQLQLLYEMWFHCLSKLRHPFST